MEQSWERFEKAFAAKVKGAWNLHVATRDCKLDMFVLFSSTSSLIGSTAHGSYAAANSVLDALTDFRRSQQLPSQTFSWGPWVKVGMAADQVDFCMSAWLLSG